MRGSKLVVALLKIMSKVRQKVVFAAGSFSSDRTICIYNWGMMMMSPKLSSSFPSQIKNSLRPFMQKNMKGLAKPGAGKAGGGEGEAYQRHKAKNSLIFQLLMFCSWYIYRFETFPIVVSRSVKLASFQEWVWSLLERAFFLSIAIFSSVANRKSFVSRLGWSLPVDELKGLEFGFATQKWSCCKGPGHQLATRCKAQVSAHSHEETAKIKANWFDGAELWQMLWD